MYEHGFKLRGLWKGPDYGTYIYGHIQTLARHAAASLGRACPPRGLVRRRIEACGLRGHPMQAIREEKTAEA